MVFWLVFLCSLTSVFLSISWLMLDSLGGSMICSYPIPPEGEWDLVVVWFHLRYYYYTRSSSSSSSSKGWSVKVGQISIFS